MQSFEVSRIQGFIIILFQLPKKIVLISEIKSRKEGFGEPICIIARGGFKPYQALGFFNRITFYNQAIYFVMPNLKGFLIVS